MAGGGKSYQSNGAATTEHAAQWVCGETRDEASIICDPSHTDTELTREELNTLT